MYSNIYVQLLPETQLSDHSPSAHESAASLAGSLHKLQEICSRPSASSAALQAHPYAARHPASVKAIVSNFLKVTSCNSTMLQMCWRLSVLKGGASLLVDVVFLLQC